MSDMTSETPALDTVPDDTTIVVVSGLPRSGTSMLMQMLVAGGLNALTDGVRDADDDNPIGYFEHERIKRLQKDNDWLAEAQGKVIKVVAPLISFLPPGQQYRVAFILRDVDEVVRSQQKMLDRLGQKGASMSADMLAKQFAMLLERTRSALEKRFQGEILFIQHRECIASPEKVAADLQAFLAKPLDIEAMANSVNPDLYRNRSQDNQ
jgi:hypothetical protein